MICVYFLICSKCEPLTWSARVSRGGASAASRLPGEEVLLRRWGQSLWTMISAPWSVLALAVSLKVSLWVSIYKHITNNAEAGASKRSFDNNDDDALFITYACLLLVHTFFFPPPGVWVMFSIEPTLDWTALKSTFSDLISTFPPPAQQSTELKHEVQQLNTTQQ